MTGHNDRPLIGDRYLVNLETALQRLMDEGEAALVPSYRPAGLQQVLVGDRLTDPDWIAINVNRATFLPSAVEKIATLSALGLEGATLDTPFTPGTREYTATANKGARHVNITASPTSSRAKRVSVDGRVVRPDAVLRTALKTGETPIRIEVRAPDGVTTGRYLLKVARSD